MFHDESSDDNLLHKGCTQITILSREEWKETDAFDAHR
jgi:hypothetical protein